MEALAKLGIDTWGIILYLVNFGILLVLMHKFVYKPLIKTLDQRREKIKNDIAEAHSLREELETSRQEEEMAKKARLNELDEDIQKAKNTAKEEAKNIVATAEEQKEQLLSNASKMAEEKIDGALKEAEGEMKEYIQKIVSHVLKDMPEKAVKDSVEKSLKNVSKLS